MGLLTHWTLVRSRRTAGSLVAIAVMLGLLGGLSLLSLAGARRTQSSYPRFLRTAHASTMAVNPGPYDPEVDAFIAGLPEVEKSATYVGFTTGRLVHGKPDFEYDFEVLGTFDGRFFTMDRFTPTTGRMSDPTRTDEIVVNQTAADRYGFRVGDQMDLGTYADEQTFSDSFFTDPPPPKLENHVTIVGVGLFTDEVVQDDTNRYPLLLVTPAFSRAAAPYATYAWQGLILRHGDADIAAVKKALLAASDPGTPQFYRVTSVDTFHATQAVRPLSLALAVFGAVAGAAALVLTAQAVNRRIRADRRDLEMVRAFGASPRTVAAMGAAGPLLALAAGAVLAATLALLASPAMPLGATRQVEAAPGFDLDWTILGGGAVVAMVLLGAAAITTAMRELPNRRTTRATAHRPSVLTRAAASVGVSPSGVSGLRMTFGSGDQSSAAPVRSVMAAGTVAIAALVAALTFGQSFQTLLHTPPLYGWNWDAAVLDQSGYGNIDLAGAHRLLDHRREIEAWSGAYFGADSLDGRNLPLLGMEPGSDVTPSLLEGRMIRSADEVVLGQATAHLIHKQIGDDVSIGSGPTTAPLRVVGIATFPTIGIVHGDHTSMGVGALVAPTHVPGFDRQTRGEGSGPPGAPVGPPVLLVRYAAGHRAAAARLVDRGGNKLGQFPGSAYVLAPQRPAEIVNSARVGGASTLLAATLAVGAAASLGLVLASSVRRRRLELATLRSLGFTGRQLSSTIAWQATATVGVGLALGLPIGIALGRGLWQRFARQLDVVPAPTVPLVALATLTVAALLVANLTAAVPGRTARRMKPGAVFRGE